MNSTKKISAAIMVVSLIVGSTSAFAYGHHKNGCGHHHKGLYKQLNLTDKQKEEFKNIRESKSSPFPCQFVIGTPIQNKVIQ